MLDQMVKNFDEKTRGIEIMLDAGHNSDREAYGWFKSLSVKMGEDGKAELWGTVELTSLGQRSLTEKLYGYISADFDMSYKDNESLVNHGAVLLGAGLTNRPVVKRMSPAIELQEEKDMTVKKLADPLLEKQVVCADGANSPDVQKLLDATGVATVDELIALIGSLKDQVAAAQGEIEMACQSDKFNKMMSEGKAVEAQRKFFMEKDFENFAAHSMPIKLEEISKNERVVEEDEEKAEDKIMKLAEAKMSEEKISLTEAIGQVLAEDKELNKQYRKEKGE